MRTTLLPVEEHLMPFLSKLDTVSGEVFLDAFFDGGPTVNFAFRMDAEVDASRPMIPQLRTWLTNCAAQIEAARVGLQRLDGVCDHLPQKFQEAKVSA